MAAADRTASCGAATLWSVGAKDTNTAKFALGPKDYQAYRQPGVFIVGESDARKDWPYVQPGVADGWGPGTPQTFEVFFALENAPGEPCRLELDFADTHSSNPPRLRVEVNDLAKEFQTPAGAGDASVNGEPAKGRPYVISLDVPAATLKAGENRVAITTLTGSWVLWDAAQFEAPSSVKLATLKDRTWVTAIAASRTTLAWHEGKPAHVVTLDVRRIGGRRRRPCAWASSRPSRSCSGRERKLSRPSPRRWPRGETVPVALAVGGQVVAQKDVELEPVRQWVVYILMHSHVDIGYTDIQPHIAAKQAHNVTRALELDSRDQGLSRRRPVSVEPRGPLDLRAVLDQRHARAEARLRAGGP